MPPTYEMQYFVDHHIEVEHFFAGNDDEAVEISKQKFLGLAQHNKIPDNSTLSRVCREPTNLLKEGYKLSVKTSKDISLIEG
jgi:hypothetical protein